MLEYITYYFANHHNDIIMMMINIINIIIIIIIINRPPLPELVPSGRICSFLMLERFGRASSSVAFASGLQ